MTDFSSFRMHEEAKCSVNSKGELEEMLVLHNSLWLLEGHELSITLPPARGKSGQVYQHVMSEAFQTGTLPWHCSNVGSPYKPSDHPLVIPFNYYSVVSWF